ncbi:50S ribosomal protein L11 methyltransferase [Thermoactinomyces mirandus]|uniref:Ribosomal protein L11 methyltransferase n=1 Tax=Thermoactinomyces mirandus TaxID=2756294 RepID=A0A7W1XP88_9BACL|nr:50S ribosomal protein L11 methyltransferase [Thermoactinomyces mirandus]MBA4600768.1 50S ribosomal protein L11 methyltransferase [Thermoactinomyces mirandus]
MNWLEISVHTGREALEAVSQFLQDLGAGGVAIEDSEVLHRTFADHFGEIVELSPEDYPEEGVIVKAYLSDLKRLDGSGLIRQVEMKLKSLEQIGLDVRPARVEVRTVSESSWENEWKKYYKPVQVSGQITIKPVWENYEARGSGEKIIQMDPGMAFGTGTHPTTRLSIQLLEKYMPSQASVIDVGCGSGILSIVAGKLGAGKILALDKDPLAVEKAGENIRLNPLDSQIVVKEGDLLKGVSETADVVVANILAEIIAKMVYDLPRVLVPGGIFIGSGIVREKAEIVEKALVSCGLKVLEAKQQEGWVAIAAKKW